MTVSTWITRVGESALLYARGLVALREPPPLKILRAFSVAQHAARSSVGSGTQNGPVNAALRWAVTQAGRSTTNIKMGAIDATDCFLITLSIRRS